MSLKESLGVRRDDEPVRVGVPFPRGKVREERQIRLEREGGGRIPVQVGILDRWTDGSVKWALLDFQASVPERGEAEYRLRVGNSPGAEPLPDLPVRRRARHVEVDTGTHRFLLDTGRFCPICSVSGRGNPLAGFAASRTVLRDGAGTAHDPLVDRVEVETSGPLRTTLRFAGVFAASAGRRGSSFCDFESRLSFFRGRSLVEMDFTLRNRSAAVHRGGMWDLGDPGSIFLRELSFRFGTGEGRRGTVHWRAEEEGTWERLDGGAMEIYQDSSGGERWDSPNHVNRFGAVSPSYRGYRVFREGGIHSEGHRATPVVCLNVGDDVLSATVRDFWQNYPKSLGVSGGEIVVGVFPERSRDPHELQGGEQKTHTIYLECAPRAAKGKPLEWVHAPLVAVIDPRYLAETRVFPYLVAWDSDPNQQYKDLVSRAVSGADSFFSRREIIDEYGWRNFGDLFADHEAVYYKGPPPPISHYNNQYDAILGSLLQHARSGQTEWFRLAQDLARHVMDIDIYHTDGDKSAFNGGMFWHTDHYSDAGTATHRTYSRRTKEERKLKTYGGGPSNEHLYTTGLLYFHWLTGNMQARETVIGLADWVLSMEDGSRTPFRFLCGGETGLASKTVERDYHGPGRGAGNSVNALLDAYVLTERREYLEFAERLIRRCIHPGDAIVERDLADHERRWSYTVFLQYLGKYLDLKTDRGEQDVMFQYGRESLLHYAEWMLEHELPFRESLDRVEYPTETWIVHDLRKSNVLEFAARYDEGTRRSRFLRKAEFFFDGCFRDLQAFETRTLTRPMVIMMSCGIMHAYFRNHPDFAAAVPRHVFDFGRPAHFRAQRAVAIARAKMICGGAALLCAGLGILSLLG